MILTTGELRGSWAALGKDVSAGGNVFANAPFILLSNKGEQLAIPDSNNTGNSKITSLRTILVNGAYESMIDQLKKRFPGISFRTAEQIDDNGFETKNEFISWNDRIMDKVKQEIGQT